MKKSGILNKDLLELIVEAGHNDLIIVTDRGFPLPTDPRVKVVDLGISKGIPSFLDIVSLISKELEVQKVYFSQESFVSCPEYVSNVKKTFGEETQNEIIPHSDILNLVLGEKNKKLGRLVGFVRTGEFTSYSNIILECGVAFDVIKKEE